MKYIVILLLAFVFVQTLQAQNPYKFLKLDFDEVKVYLYDGSRGQLIVENGKLDSTIINPKGYSLSKQQLKKLDELLGSYPDGTSGSCFDPHHGVVFYKKKRIVGQLAICFTCGNADSDFELISEFSVYRLMPLFDSFQLKVEGQFYQCRDDELADAIKKVNEKRYGKDYHKKR